MNYSAATCFDEKDWNKYGLNWLRAARSNSMTGFVVGIDLPEQAVAKIGELNFTHLPIVRKYNFKCDLFYTLLQALDRDSFCLWTENNLLPRHDLEPKFDACCQLSEYTAYAITSPVINLHDRAAMISSLEEQIQKVHGSMLSTRYILGSYNFWNGFLGCQSYLYQKQYLDSNMPCDDLILNFFMAFANSVSLEIKKYE